MLSLTHTISVTKEDNKAISTATNVAYGMVSCDQRASGGPMYELVSQSCQPSSSSATPTAAFAATPSTIQLQYHGTEEPEYY